MMHALGVFVVYVILDMLYGWYTLAVARGRVLTAANTSAIIYSLGAVGLISVTSNWLYLIPLALGAWLGTYIVVKRDVDKQELSI